MAGKKLLCAGCLETISEGEIHQVCSVCKRAFHTNHSPCPQHSTALMETRNNCTGRLANQIPAPMQAAANQQVSNSLGAATIYIAPPSVTNNTSPQRHTHLIPVIKPGFWALILAPIVCASLTYLYWTQWRWLGTTYIPVMIIFALVYGPIFGAIIGMASSLILDIVFFGGFGIDGLLFFGIMSFVAGFGARKIVRFRSWKGILTGYMFAFLGIGLSVLVPEVLSSGFTGEALSILIEIGSDITLNTLIVLPFMMWIAGKWRDQ